MPQRPPRALTVVNYCGFFATNAPLVMAAGCWRTWWDTWESVMPGKVSCLGSVERERLSTGRHCGSDLRAALVDIRHFRPRATILALLFGLMESPTCARNFPASLQRSPTRRLQARVGPMCSIH
jgi:hypothetical protein